MAPKKIHGSLCKGAIPRPNLVNESHLKSSEKAGDSCQILVSVVKLRIPIVIENGMK